MIATYCECVFVALGTHYATRTRHIAICGLSGRTALPHIFSLSAGFQKTLLGIKCNLIFCTVLCAADIVLRVTERGVVKCVLVLCWCWCCVVLVLCWFCVGVGVGVLLVLC